MCVMPSQLKRQEDMTYTGGCSSSCRNACVNNTQTNCTMGCCNSTGCLHSTLASMVRPNTTTGKPFLFSNHFFYTIKKINVLWPAVVHWFKPLPLDHMHCVPLKGWVQIHPTAQALSFLYPSSLINT